MPLPDPNASDWSELDLLMVADAVERLGAERVTLLAEIDAEIDPDRLGAAQRRLQQLERSLARAETATPVVTPGRVRTRAEVAQTPGPPD
ncbi:hypothetical protein [Pseudonocardia sp. GCM10023141]|uniref:hypothetical protein n=1 Tax=Pseudonocardia sp. GCM10023141 TaxID=3252653 RepID=UPI00360F9300